MNDIEIIPYGKKPDGTPVIPDYIVHEFFGQMVKDGTVKRVFNEGEVTSANEFLQFIQDKTHRVWFIWSDRPCAVAWLDEMNQGAYWASFCVLSNAWGSLAIKMGRKMLEYWFHFEPIKGISGITPENNKFAVKYIEKLGGKIIGILPDAVYDYYQNKQVGAVISYYRSEDYG